MPAMTRLYRILPALFGTATLTVLPSCKPKNRAQIAGMKVETERLVEEQRTVAGETSALGSQLEVLGRNSGRVEEATAVITEKTTRLQRNLSNLEAANLSIKEQTEALKAEHAAYRKKNALP